MPLIWNDEAVELFYRFIAERQAIWHRRFVERRPQPWTDDPILLKNKFTNIYREMDPGTIFARKHILETLHPRPDRIFNIMLYRLMCSIPTYQGMGFQTLESFDWKQFEDYLSGLYDTGEPVFGNAYLISPYSSMGSAFKYINVARLFRLVHANMLTIFNQLDECSSMEAAFKIINSQYGFGPFLAYQVCVDLTYPIETDGSPILPFSQNDWARLGPGALRGLDRMTPVYSTAQALTGLRYLWSRQHEKFAEYGIEFHYLPGELGEPPIAISLANMQNCLCEFSKYMNIRNGTGKAQRLFTPTDRREW